MLSLLLGMLFLAQTSMPGPAPVATQPRSASPRAENLRVFLVTMGPGDDAWEKFGHNMLVILDDDTDGAAYNWGVFEFDNHFIWNFIQGKLWYWMETDPAAPVIDYYIRDLDRTVWSQELNLTPRQRLELLDFCQTNALPQNKYYKYDYFKDNCSTRVRDAIDHVLDGQIKQQASSIMTNDTYRSETLRLTADVPWLYVSLDYVLGQPTDRKLTAWQKMFIPMHLRDELKQVQVKDDSGRLVPLVISEKVLHVSSRERPLREPPNRVGWFLAAGILLGGVMSGCAFAVARSNAKAKPQTKWWRIVILTVFVIVAMFWVALSALGGGFLSFAWLFTDHSAARPNQNILQLGPWMIPMIVLVPLALRHWRRTGVVGFYVAAAAAGLSLLGLLLKVLPMMYQVNSNIIALALPTNIGLAAAMWKLTQVQPPTAQAQDPSGEPVKQNTKPRKGASA